MVIGRLSCGRFAPGSGRVVVVRSLRSWLPTREGPLEPLSWPRRLLARLLARKAFSSLLEGSRGETASRPFLFFIKGALQAPARAADRHWKLLEYSIGSIVSQDEPSGSSRKRVRLSNRPSSFQHCGWLMFTSARGRRSGNRSWTV